MYFLDIFDKIMTLEQSDGPLYSDCILDLAKTYGFKDKNQ